MTMIWIIFMGMNTVIPAHANRIHLTATFTNIFMIQTIVIITTMTTIITTMTTIIMSTAG